MAFAAVIRFWARKFTTQKALEGDVPEIDGLGLLRVETHLMTHKTTRTTDAVSLEYGVELDGYEIHMGYTDGADTARPMLSLDGRIDGAMSKNGKVRGCYLHGLFNADSYRKALLQQIGAVSRIESFKGDVDAALDELAEELEKHLDVDGMLGLAREV